MTIVIGVTGRPIWAVRRERAAACRRRPTRKREGPAIHVHRSSWCLKTSSMRAPSGSRRNICSADRREGHELERHSRLPEQRRKRRPAAGRERDMVDRAARVPRPAALPRAGPGGRRHTASVPGTAKVGRATGLQAQQPLVEPERACQVRRAEGDVVQGLQHGKSSCVAAGESPQGKLNPFETFDSGDSMGRDASPEADARRRRSHDRDRSMARRPGTPTRWPSTAERSSSSRGPCACSWRWPARPGEVLQQRATCSPASGPVSSSRTSPCTRRSASFDRC